MNVAQIFRDASFGPEEIEALCKAYELASASLHDRNRRPAVVNETIARRIIVAAEGGERDPHVLADVALKAMGFKGLE